jgi:DNA recombination protein RmuC
VVESIISIISIVIGFFLGWLIKLKTSPPNRDHEIESYQTELQDRITSETQAITRLAEFEKQLTEFKEIRLRLEESQKAETAANTRVENSIQQIKDERARLVEIRAEMENSFKSLASQAIKSNSEEFLKLANEKFKTSMENAEIKFDEKKNLIDQNLGEMHKTLKGLTDQSITLNTRLEETSIETGKLRETAIGLREVLSSSQKRGQWGERMVEDILQYIGLIENVNYLKQTVVESGERPDYTFMLPKEKKLNMDVKFPLTHYENFLSAEDDHHQKVEKEHFLKDVKKHIKDVAGRNYINPEEGTLDYVMVFIPNESIYGFINTEDPELVNFSLEKKVLLCSPLTLYAVLSLIHQATQNFAMEERASEVMNLVNVFRKQWGMYVKSLEKLGNSIESSKNTYDNLMSTRTRQLEKPLKKIEELSQGSQESIIE